MVTSPKKNSVDCTQPNPDSQLFDSLPPNDNQDKKCDVSNSAVDGGDEGPPHPSRDERLAKHKNQCQNLTYLRTNVCPPGLTKREVRNINNQAKTHQWDFKSKLLFDPFIYLAKLYHS